MSWATHRATIEGLSAFDNYDEIPENKVPDTMPQDKHKSYSLKWIGTDETDMYASGSISYVNKIELQVSYINMASSNRDANVALFVALLTAIAGATGFNSFVGGFSFEDKDNKNTIGKVEFYFGSEGLCG